MLKRILKNFCLCGFLICGCANAEVDLMPAGDNSEFLVQEVMKGVWFGDDNNVAPDKVFDAGFSPRDSFDD